jgi:hypothetical protein
VSTDRWFYPVSSTNNTDRHGIAEMVLKVELNTMTLQPICLIVVKKRATVNELLTQDEIFNNVSNMALVAALTVALFLTTIKHMGCRVMVFNSTFNTISAIPWRSVLLVEETG